MITTTSPQTFTYEPSTPVVGDERYREQRMAFPPVRHRVVAAAFAAVGVDPPASAQ